MNQLQTDFKVDRSAMSDVEWDLRVQLAAAYRLVEHFGWTELIYGHLTVRVPGAEPHFLINPFGLKKKKKHHFRTKFRRLIYVEAIICVYFG